MVVPLRLVLVSCSFPRSVSGFRFSSTDGKVLFLFDVVVVFYLHQLLCVMCVRASVCLSVFVCVCVRVCVCVCMVWLNSSDNFEF